MGKEFDASYYDANGQAGDRPALWFYARLARSFIAPGRVLDFGCGTGFFLKRLKKYFAIEGYEIAPYARDRAQALVPDVPIFARLEELPPRRYAGITALHVLEHVNDNILLETFRHWRRALVPNGRVLCVIPDPSGKGYQMKGTEWFGFRDPTHINLKSRSQWHHIFVEQGFRVLQTGTDGLWDFPYTKGVPKVIDAALHSVGTVVQFGLGRLTLPEGAGESAIFLLEFSSAHRREPE
jgi:SAM-dependent methyltransferase